MLVIIDALICVFNEILMLISMIFLLMRFLFDEIKRFLFLIFLLFFIFFLFRSRGLSESWENQLLDLCLYFHI